MTRELRQQGIAIVEQYLDYIRAIRERIWLPVLIGGAAILVVIGLRLLPTKQASYTARGRVLLDPIAFRTITSQGDELSIAYPQPDSGFWATLVGFGTGPDTVQSVLANLRLETDARDRYAIIVGAERLSVGRQPSAYLEFHCTSNDGKISLKVTDELMRYVCEEWKATRVRDAQAVLDTLKKRLPGAEADIAKAQLEMRAIEARHGGVAPDREADTIASSLVAVQLALQNADLEATAGRTRSQRLLAQPERPEVAAQAANVALQERIDSVKQEIMNREMALADMLERRTPEHPAVRELTRQIAELQKRVKDLEATAKKSVTSDFVRQAEIEARAYAEEMASRRDVLTKRENDLRAKLSDVRTDVLRYQEAASNADAVLKRYLHLKNNIAAAEAEVLARTRAEMLKIQAKAELDKQPSQVGTIAMNLLMAGLGGIGAGILVIVALHFFDTTFRNEDDAARLLGCPILAGIPHSDVELVTADAPADAQANAPPQPLT